MTILRFAMAGLIAMSFWSTPEVASAQQVADRYIECQRIARQVTGYRGPAPSSRQGDGAVGGAVKGAALGAIIGAIGGKKVDTGKAAGLGALLGGLAGAIGRAKRESDANRTRDAYRFELDACLRAG